MTRLDSHFRETQTVRTASSAPRITLDPAILTALVALSAVGFGLVPYFARNLTDSGMGAPAVTLFRWGLTAIALAPWVRLERRKLAPLNWGFGAGVVVGLGWMAYVEALSVMPVPTISVIYMTYPIFAILAARFLFARRADLRSTLAAGIVAIAATIALSPTAVGAIGFAVVALAFASPLTYGFGLTVLAERMTPLSPVERMAAFATGAMIAVLPPFLALDRSEQIPADARGWVLVAAMGLLTSLLPKLGYSTAAPVIGGTRVAIVGAIELPTMLLVAWFAFGEALNWKQLVASALILAAVWISSQRPRSIPKPATPT